MHLNFTKNMMTTKSKEAMVYDLDDFTPDKQIFVDANIFTFHLMDDPRYGESCTGFLQKIEDCKINGVTSSFVLDEVVYVLLIGKGCEILDVDRAWKVRKEIKRNKGFAMQCYEPVNIFLDYIDSLKLLGLHVIDVRGDDVKDAVKFAVQYQLLPRDAIIISLMKQHNIKHIATCDSDFERVDFLNVWKIPL